MRRTQLALMALFIVASGSPRAQVTVVSPAPPRPAVGGATAEAAVARVMSFDRDRDGRVVKDELIDRMQDLVARGDANGDGGLDAAEVERLTWTPTVLGARQSGLPHTYQLPMDSWFPERSHIDGALADLKLDRGTYAEASAVVTAHEPRVDAATRRTGGQLLRDLEPVLTFEQLADLQTLLERNAARQLRTWQTFTIDSERMINQARRALVSTSGARRTFAFPGNVRGLIEHFGLSAEKSVQADAALDRYEANLRAAGEVERGALVERMAGVLTEEERGNFRAALARRSATSVHSVREVIDVMRGRSVAAAPAVPTTP